jgi:hypothetical protein
MEGARDGGEGARDGGSERERRERKIDGESEGTRYRGREQE